MVCLAVFAVRSGFSASMFCLIYCSPSNQLCVESSYDAKTFQKELLPLPQSIKRISPFRILGTETISRVFNHTTLLLL